MRTVGFTAADIAKKNNSSSSITGIKPEFSVTGELNPDGTGVQHLNDVVQKNEAGGESTAPPEKPKSGRPRKAKEKDKTTEPETVHTDETDSTDEEPVTDENGEADEADSDG